MKKQGKYHFFDRILVGTRFPLEPLTGVDLGKVKKLKGGINAWAREVDKSLPIY